MLLSVVKQIAQLLSGTGIVWGLGGSMLLKQKGLVEVTNDIDLLVAEPDAMRVHELLKTVGTGQRGTGKDPSYSQYFFMHEIDGVSIDVIGGYRLRHDGGMFEVPFDSSSINGHLLLDGVQVPLSSLEDWFVIYRLLQRTEKAQLIAAYWRQHGMERRGLLQRSLLGVLPERLRAEIEGLLSIRKLNIADMDTAAEVLSVQLPAYRVEAEIIGFDGIPPLLDTVETLSGCGETFYGYYLGEKLVGAISYKREEDVLDIHRMVVHPAYFRLGIASRLLEHLFAVETGVRKTLVSTGSLNQPAKELYQRHGFTEVRVWDVVPDVSVTLFEKS